eukprot:gnl/MRDRNA2_/MRDRNA2_100941_c0_seq1.p1 gnl/MRDRNA2_/MRDRNA2_100941_c0~~gnl/MRDRNA2_/MRDRNA2_100941_c0_seq1.p1  ORF type:complete len:199 (+),score=43.45 gnl/MRDRNA2_/MRDRNA2_100941_c0_seq1:82-678(+)
MCGSAAVGQPVADPVQKGAAHAPQMTNVINTGKILVKVMQLSGEEILSAELDPEIQVAVLRSFAAFALEQPVQSCRLFANDQELRANLSVADSGLLDGDTVTALIVPAACSVDNAHLGVVESQMCLTSLAITLSHVEARGGLGVTLSGQANITGARGSLKPGNYYYYVEVKAPWENAVTFSELVNVHTGVSEVLWMAR